MTIHFTGGCACGTIRYEWSAEPVLAGNCHCRDCQRATGGTCAPWSSCHVAQVQSPAM